MNRTIATALIAVASAVAGQAYAAPDSYEPQVAITAQARAASEVRAEALQATKVSGTIVGADTLVTAPAANSASRNRDQVRIEALQAANTHTAVLASPQ